VRDVRRRLESACPVGAEVILLDPSTLDEVEASLEELPMMVTRSHPIGVDPPLVRQAPAQHIGGDRQFA
jgi:hypothetical protein